ncbi:MAG: hypothetical protein Q9164_001026 [Protoblastenia rupestris]
MHVNRRSTWVTLALLYSCAVSISARNVNFNNASNQTVVQSLQATATATAPTPTEFIWPVVSSFYLHINTNPKLRMRKQDADEILKAADRLVGKKQPGAMVTEEIEVTASSDLILIITPIPNQLLSWTDVGNTVLGLHEFFQDQLGQGRELCSTYFWIKDKKRELRFGEGALKRKRENLLLNGLCNAVNTE